MHEMLKLNFNNTSRNISILNHISNDEDHVYHTQSCYPTFSLVLLLNKPQNSEIKLYEKMKLKC
jgi:hypothetical protein